MHPNTWTFLPFASLPFPSLPSRSRGKRSVVHVRLEGDAQELCVRLPACEQVRRWGCGAARVTGRRSRCWPSFPDNVIMGRDSWQLRFLSAQISRDINNEWHGRATSAAAQRAHDCSSRSPSHPLSLYLCVFSSLSFFFSSPDSSPFHLHCSLLSHSPSSFTRVMANINLSLPHRCICTLF